MSNKLLISEGKAARGSVDVSGSYAAPPGPDWGWRTTLGPGPDETLRMVMYNVTPDGEEYLAVEPSTLEPSETGKPGTDHGLKSKEAGLAPKRIRTDPKTVPHPDAL